MAKSTPVQTTAERRKRTTIDPNESKSDKFRRLVNARMSQAKKSITGIANLSGNGYEHTPEQRTRIIADLKAWVANVEKAFASGGPGRSADSYSI